MHNIHTIPSLKGYQGSNSFFLSTSKALLRRVFLLEKEVCIGFFFLLGFQFESLWVRVLCILLEKENRSKKVKSF